MHFPFFVAITFSLLTDSAHAAKGAPGCSTLTGSLSFKMDQYRSYKADNEKSQAELEASEASCKERGSDLSARIAKAAEAQSCEAQADASKMNRETETLGTECTAVFAKRHTLQSGLRARFADVKFDLDEAEKFMRNSALIKESCPDELQTASVMVQAFLKLEAGILGVETRALDAKTDYGKFTLASSELKKLTEALAVKCGNVNADLPATKTAGKGSGEAPKAKAAKGASDISGTPKAIEDAKKGEAATKQNP